VFRSAILAGTILFIASQCLADEPVQPSQPTRPSPDTMKELRAACAADVQKLCPGVQPGGGRIMQCLSEHKSEVSEICKQAVQKARQGSSAG
jgi:hypothetical protein